MGFDELIIGIVGAGAVGSQIAERSSVLVKNPVLVYDSDPQRTAKLAQKTNIRAAENARYVAENADIIYIATAPLRYNPKIIAEIAPFAKQGSIIVDESSVKTLVGIALIKNSPPSVGISLRHLMGAPNLPSWNGLIRAFIPLRIVDAERQYQLDQLETALGLNLVKIDSADTHDRITSVVQGETQTLTFGAGNAHRILGYNHPSDITFPDAKEYKNPLDHIKWMLTLRMHYLHLLSPGVYPDIAATNPYVSGRVAHYLNTGQKLNYLIQHDKKDELKNLCLSARDNLGRDNIAESEAWLEEKLGGYDSGAQTNSHIMVLAQGISWLTYPEEIVHPRDLNLFSSPPYRWFLRLTESVFGKGLERFIDNAFENQDVKYHDTVFWNAVHALCSPLLLKEIDPITKAEFYEAQLTQNAHGFDRRVLEEGFKQSQELFKK